MDYNLIDLKGNLTIKKGNLLRLSKRRTSNPTIQVKKRNSVIDSVFLDLTITFLQLLNCNESSQLMLIPPLHVVKPMVLVNLVSKLGPQVGSEHLVRGRVSNQQSSATFSWNLSRMKLRLRKQT